MNPPGLHGLAAGEAGRPEAADWTVPQRLADYSADEHTVWKTLFQRQTALLPGRACDEFVAGMRDLPLSPERIPDFDQVNETLWARSGWRLVAVPGLVPDEVFFEHLANRRFPVGRFIRSADQLDYLQEPDVFHDVFGHVPMLMHPVMADFIQAYGVGGLKAQRLGALPLLARVYWYTVEFGLVRHSAGGLRLFGAGIASSRTESVFCLDDASPHRIGFDLQRVMRTNYRIDDFQQSYFVLESLDDLLHLAEVDFEPLYAQVGQQAALSPDTLLPSDRLWHRGNQSHRCQGRAMP